MSPEVDSFRSLVNLTLQQYKSALREGSATDNKYIYQLFYIAQLEWLIVKSDNVRNVTPSEATSLGEIKASWLAIAASKPAIASRLNEFYLNKSISSFDWGDFISLLEDWIETWDDPNSSLDDMARAGREWQREWEKEQRNEGGGGGGGPGKTR